MISTTTVSTAVSTVTMKTSLAPGLGMLSTIILSVLLFVKNLAGATSAMTPISEPSLRNSLNKVLNIGVIPLLVAFTCIVIEKILHFL